MGSHARSLPHRRTCDFKQVAGAGPRKIERTRRLAGGFIARSTCGQSSDRALPGCPCANGRPSVHHRRQYGNGMAALYGSRIGIKFSRKKFFAASNRVKNKEAASDGGFFCDRCKESHFMAPTILL